MVGSGDSLQRPTLSTASPMRAPVGMPGSGGSDEVVVNGEARGCRTSADAELAVDRLEMVTDGAGADGWAQERNMGIRGVESMQRDR